MTDKQEIQNLINEHKRRLAELEKKQARLGINTPPEVVNEIRDIKDEIERLEQELEDSKIESVYIQVVTIAMTLGEAEQLISGEIFKNQEERKQFEELRVVLQEYELADFTAHYKESRDAWCPLIIGNQKSVETILRGLVKDFNERQHKVEISLKFRSDDYFSEEHCYDTFEALEEKGGILIVDALSIYHPDIRECFIKSRLPNNRVAMIVISPLKAIRIKRILETQIYVRHMSRIFERDFAVHLDPFYEFGVSDLHRLRRWLFAMLPSIRSRGLTVETKDAIRAERGQPRGIRNRVIGSRG